MTPLERFGAMVYRAWCEQDCMDLDGADIEGLAHKSGVVVYETYDIEKHGTYMRDNYDAEPGVDQVNAPVPGVAERVDEAHKKQREG